MCLIKRIKWQHNKRASQSVSLLSEEALTWAEVWSGGSEHTEPTQTSRTGSDHLLSHSCSLPCSSGTISTNPQNHWMNLRGQKQIVGLVLHTLSVGPRYVNTFREIFLWCQHHRVPFDQLSWAECERTKISKHVTEEGLTLMHGWQLVLRFLAQLIRFINIIQVLHLKISECQQITNLFADIHFLHIRPECLLNNALFKWDCSSRTIIQTFRRVQIKVKICVE